LKIKIHSEHLLIWQIFVQNNISYEIRDQYILSACSCICHNQFSGNDAFSTEFWDLWTESLLDSFINLCISLASVTTKMLLQRDEKIKVTWCQDATARHTTALLQQLR